MKKIVLFGSGGHAKVIADIIEKESRCKICGIIDPQKSIGSKILGYPVLGTENELPNIIKKFCIDGGIIAIGDNWKRHLIAQIVLKLAPEFKFFSTIHPSAQIAKQVTLGKGTVVMPGAVINPGTKIGEFCIINTNSSIDHDNIVGNYSSIMPNAATGGNVKVGDFSALGMGCSILQNIQIGAQNVIGAGTIILENTPDNAVVFGSPAKVIKIRKPGDPYL
ncbi:MAG: acetyltransferase [Nitrospinota bacterium]